jgi:hypothetical protein
MLNKGKNCFSRFWSTVNNATFGLWNSVKFEGIAGILEGIFHVNPIRKMGVSAVLAAIISQ